MPRTTSRRSAPSRRRRGRAKHWIRVERYWEGDVPGRAAEVPPGDVPAVRQRAVRAGVPDLREPSHRGRPERAGLQPLHRHPLLRQRLPVQRPVLRLLQPVVGQAAPAAAEPRRVAARGRRDGEVHVLRAADQGRADPGQGRRARRWRTARSSRPARRRARRRRWSSAISTTRRARSRDCRARRAAASCSRTSARRPNVTYLPRQTAGMSRYRDSPPQSTDDLLRPLMQTSWRFYLLVVVLRQHRPRRALTAWAYAGVPGLRRHRHQLAGLSGASTSRASSSGSASATPAR